MPYSRQLWRDKSLGKECSYIFLLTSRPENYFGFSSAAENVTKSKPVSLTCFRSLTNTRAFASVDWPKCLITWLKAGLAIASNLDDLLNCSNDNTLTSIGCGLTLGEKLKKHCCSISVETPSHWARSLAFATGHDKPSILISFGFVLPGRIIYLSSCCICLCLVITIS